MTVTPVPGVVRAVTVDLDDTLFPQAQWLDGAWCAVAGRAAALGLDGAALLPELRRVAAEGSDRGGIIDRALARVVSPVTPAVVSELVSAFAGHAPDRLDCYDGAFAALGRLSAELPVVLITDGNPRIQHAKVAALGIADLLDAIVVSDELGGRVARKPAPAPFLRALELLDLPAEAVVHVGDRPGKDVLGALGVGMRALRVRTGEYADTADGDAGSAPWAVADTFAQAVDLLLARVLHNRREHRSALARL